MRFRLTGRERALVIGAAVLLALGALYIGLIMPLEAQVSGQRVQLAAAEAKLALAREAEANAAEIDRRLAQLTEAWQALQLSEGDHQAALVRRLDGLERQAGVRIDTLAFEVGGSGGSGGTAGTTGSGGSAGGAKVGSASAGDAAGRTGFRLSFTGAPAACVDFIARVEELPDVVVLASSVATASASTGTVGTVEGYLVEAPR